MSIYLKIRRHARNFRPREARPRRRASGAFLLNIRPPLFFLKTRISTEVENLGPKIWENYVPIDVIFIRSRYAATEISSSRSNFDQNLIKVNQNRPPRTPLMRESRSIKILTNLNQKVSIAETFMDQNLQRFRPATRSSTPRQGMIQFWLRKHGGRGDKS